jgi:dienelactone hydrolase
VNVDDGAFDLPIWLPDSGSGPGLAGGRDEVEIHVQAGAGHAFDNHEADMFWNPSAAAVAWDQTVAFLERYLPVS